MCLQGEGNVQKELHLEEGGRAIVTLLTPSIVIKVWLFPLSLNISCLRTSKVAHQAIANGPVTPMQHYIKQGETQGVRRGAAHTALCTKHYSLLTTPSMVFTVFFAHI